MISMFPSFTDPANIVLVAIVSACVFIVKAVLRIMRYSRRNIPRQDQEIVSPWTEEKNMLKLTIPFTFKLADNLLMSGNNSLARQAVSAVPCVVSSSVPYTLQAWWGVSIKELHEFLWLPWTVMWKGVQTGEMLKVSFMHKCDATHRAPHGNKVTFIPPPERALNLGSTPRTFYPLVVIIARISPVVTDPYAPVALINVVHIKDSICTSPTSILAHYLKQKNGQLSCIKPIYKAAVSSLNLGTDSGASLIGPYQEQQRPEEHVCVACLHAPLSRALLPCRHACVCAKCFEHLSCCPMCRTSIASYFCIRDEDYMKGP